MSRPRRDELRAALARTEDRVAVACRAAGRTRDEVSLIVVTKFFPASDVADLVDLGVRDIGESRDQEAAAKVQELSALLPQEGRMPCVHFIGQVQRNKAASVARYCDTVHSLDRMPLVAALGRGAQRAGRDLGVLIQVDLSREPVAGRGGARPQDVAELAAAIRDADRLQVRGLMTVAPLDSSPEQAFSRLAVLSQELRVEHPGAAWISAGMSADLELAIGHGATHLRVGTAILGSRPPHR